MKKVNLIEGESISESVRDIEVIFAEHEDNTYWPACLVSFKEDPGDSTYTVDFFDSEGGSSCLILYKDIDMFIKALQKIKQHVEENT